jgi:hypothetical protein
VRSLRRTEHIQNPAGRTNRTRGVRSVRWSTMQATRRNLNACALNSKVNAALGYRQCSQCSLLTAGCPQLRPRAALTLAPPWSVPAGRVDSQIALHQARATPAVSVSNSGAYDPALHHQTPSRGRGRGRGRRPLPWQLGHWQPAASGIMVCLHKQPGGCQHSKLPLALGACGRRAS